MDSEEIYRLLQIAHLAQNWPNLWPIRDRALEKLAEVAKAPAHQEAKPSTGAALKRSLANG